MLGSKFSYSKLVAIIIMSVEKNSLYNIHTGEIINKVESSSKILTKINLYTFKSININIYITNRVNIKCKYIFLK